MNPVEAIPSDLQVYLLGSLPRQQVEVEKSFRNLIGKNWDVDSAFAQAYCDARDALVARHGEFEVRNMIEANRRRAGQ